jgi:hypothetical protein
MLLAFIAVVDSCKCNFVLVLDATIATNTRRHGDTQRTTCCLCLHLPATDNFYYKLQTK